MGGKTTEERRWPLSATETANLQIIAASVKEVATLYVTANALKKSISDATESIRTLFRETDFHEFSTQEQGENAKVVKNAIVIHDDVVIETVVSLYRPETKFGDPRFTIYKKHKAPPLAEPRDVVALMVYEDTLVAINLTKSRLYEGGAPAVAEFLKRAAAAANSIADELLDKLRHLAAGPLQALASGDHAIGRTIELALGLTPNPSKSPDYKGIELKGARSLRGKDRPKAQLFAQVPDWGRSPYKSITDIWLAYGYIKAGERLLRCTVNLEKPNPQGLYLRAEQGEEELHERGRRGTKDEVVAVWPYSLLHHRLLVKHAETFWIRADATTAEGVESYLLREALHTRSPSVTMFDDQLAAGNITLDHMIEPSKSNASRGYEKGPSFKVKQHALPLLFPAPGKRYKLDAA